MKKHLLLSGWLILYSFSLWAQNLSSVSLKECLIKGVENNAVSKQFSNNKKTLLLNTQNLNANYLPTLNLTGQASYQSDVTHMPTLSIPGLTFPTMSKDWYKINLNLEQLIWDGGITKTQKAMAVSDKIIADEQVKIALYQLKNKIAINYYNILFLKNNLKALALMRDDIQARIKEAKTAVQNGALLSAGLKTLQVSEKQAEQLIVQGSKDMEGLLASLSERTGISITSEDQLSTPNLTINTFPFNNQRPEYQLMEAQQNKLKALSKLTSSKRKPLLKLYGQAGYGRPGYNMLNNDFSDYYMGGIQLYWKIWDWGKTKRDRQLLAIQSNNIELSKENFKQNLSAECLQQLKQIEKYNELVQSDKEIVNLQEEVMKTAKTQFKEGIITSTEYLIELNKKIKAVLNLEAHKTQLLFSKYQYLLAMGNI